MSNHTGKVSLSGQTTKLQYFHRQYVSVISMQIRANRTRQPPHFPLVEHEKDTFLGIVNQYAHVFVALEGADVTIDMWTSDAIDSFLDDEENKKHFWEVHLSNTHQNHLKQKILILKFLAGKHFHQLRKSTDGEAYVHECEGYAHRFHRVDQMVGHIQRHHVSKSDGVHHPPFTSSGLIQSVILLQECDEVNFTDEKWLYQ